MAARRSGSGVDPRLWRAGARLQPTLRRSRSSGLASPGRPSAVDAPCHAPSAAPSPAAASSP
ncbi:hypothetical protein PAI11_16020 [Patulibacter medicamentivorans]|uniref:Uncharacterized protein n=1 Tax=Patulibacter medicamentivorans TaxID=1097667 RepID=H0E475_9ACTN|nr:hypothetical protein PAI11_16020 [Patulibacter medicamentivorans]